MKNSSFGMGFATLLSVTILSLLLLACKPSLSVESDARKFYSVDTINVMLKHLSSKLSDQELRDLWTKAGVERTTALKDFEKKRNQYYVDRAETLERCEDIAFKTKNPEKCSSAAVVPLGMSLGPMVNSQQDLFNGYLFGSCNWVGTKKALEMGCFPNGYTPTFITAKELDASRWEAFRLAR